MTLLDKVTIYVDAGFPILLIHSYEEKKIDEIVKKSAAGRELYEWNGVTGFTDFST